MALADVFEKFKRKIMGPVYEPEEEEYVDGGYTEDVTDEEKSELYNTHNVIRMDPNKMKNGFNRNFKYTEDVQSSSNSDTIMVYSPKTVEDTAIIADSIKEKKIVVLNILDSVVSAEESQRMCDYLVGVCYAVGAKVETISDDIIMMTPRGCKVVNTDKNSSYRKTSSTAGGYARASGFGK